MTIKQHLKEIQYHTEAISILTTTEKKVKKFSSVEKANIDLNKFFAKRKIK
jgi:hypothetical protein